VDLKEYLTKRGYFTNLPAKVRCAIKGKCEYCAEGEWFICELCSRSVPWCVGGLDDGGDEMCSDCWYQATQLDWVEAEAA
jgi:hypothetical protein